MQLCPKVVKHSVYNYFICVKSLLYSKYFTKLTSNFVAPYNLLDTNVLEEPTIPVFGADHNHIVDGVKILVSCLLYWIPVYSAKYEDLYHEMDSSLLLCYCCQVKVLYRCT